MGLSIMSLAYQYYLKIWAVNVVVTYSLQIKNGEREKKTALCFLFSHKSKLHVKERKYI